MTGKVVSGAGIAVGGNSPASKAVETAMRSEIVNGHEAGEDSAVTKAKLIAIRFDTKPPERR
jgi:hypothetical protein